MAETKSCPMCGTDAAGDAARCQCGYYFAASKPTDAVEWTPEMGGTQSAGDNWRTWGMVLTGVGVIGAVLSAFMEISVSSYDSDVVNLGLMFNKGAALAGSLFVIGLGVLCMGIGAIVAAIAQSAD